MQIPTVNTLPEEAKLVFHKTSSFPRHKLGLTTFKRKVKEKGADFIVGNFKKVKSTDSVTYSNAYETENEIYITQLSTINLDLLYKECYIDLSSATHYTNYEIFIVEKEQIFYIDYICGKHSLPVISDNDLNTIVDNKQERLSVTELSTIMEMVKSRDKENVNLALKLFAQFNLSSDPTLSWLFLSIYSQHFAVINSVLYTNLKKQFNPQSRAYYWGILNSLSKEKPKDDHETELITHLLQDYLTVSNLSVKTFLEFKNLGYDLKLESDE
ncbi:MAG: hypothetical protein UIH41_07740 [Treponemataceae bacterium]|nr:hypothetical protein [Treponemataceae bacterium]